MNDATNAGAPPPANTGAPTPVRKPKTVMLFRNGNVAAFDERGAQIPELQHAPISLWAARAESLGWDVNNAIVETPGSDANWRLFKNGDGHWTREMQR